MMKTLNVAVTGMGIISSVANGIEQFEQTLVSGHSNFSVFENAIVSRLEKVSLQEDLKHSTHFDEKDIAKINKMTRKAGLPIQASVIAASQAWEMANLYHKEHDPERVSLIVAGNNTTTRYLFKPMKKSRFIYPLPMQCNL